MKMNEYQIANHPGLIRAYHSTIINFPLSGLDREFGLVGETHVDRVLAVWGKLDTVVPFSCFDSLKPLIPSVKLVTKEDSGHSIPLEYPDFLSKSISYFLNE